MDIVPNGDPECHLPLASLEAGFAGLAALDGPPADLGRLWLIVRRLPDHTRETPERIVLSVDEGVTGDNWVRKLPLNPEAQISVMRRDVGELIANGQSLALFGDNLFVDFDITASNQAPGTRMRIGRAVLEVTTKPHTGCRKFAGRFGHDALRFVSSKEHAALNLRGIYWRVVESGEAAVGDAIEVVKRPD